MNLRTLGLALAALLLARTPAADSAETSGSKEILLDGLSAVVGGSPADELSRTPLLVSDVIFQARFLQLVRGQAGGSPPIGDELLRQGRRSAVFMRLLAGRARSLKETVAPNIVASIRDRLAELAGGDSELAALMERTGYSEADLTRWIEDAVLASTQIRYALDQARLETAPTEVDEGDESESEPGADGLGTRQALREVVQWLEGVLLEQHLRILR